MHDIKPPLNILLKKYLLQKQKNRGFTLIELLVVIIIIGILAAVSFPSLLAQVGKARETEATNNLGTIARSQSAYHIEHQTFADSLTKLATVGSFNSKYFIFPDPAVANANIVTHQANPIDSAGDRVRDFALGVYNNGGAVTNVICRGIDVGQAVDVGATPADNCTNNGIKVQ
jgi:type IV pilus assembly protein PilA